jgi:hypothetical protein
MSRNRRRHPLVIMALVLPLLLLLDAAAWVFWLAWHLLPYLLLAGAAVAAWRACRRRGTGPPGPARLVQGTVLPPGTSDVAGRLAAEVTRLQRELAAAQHDAGNVITALDAEREDLRKQVAKLEDDAARHDQLVEDLEAAAGRPVEAVLASYRHIQRIYTGDPQ